MALVVDTSSWRIATWNCFGAAQSPRAFLRWRGAEDAERFVHPQLLRELGALDVLCVQEVWLKDVEEFFDRLPQPHKTRDPNTSTFYPLTIGGSGLGFASHGPIVQSEMRAFTGPKRNSERVARKGVAHARVLLPGGPALDVFTTHMQSGYDAGARFVRRHQLEQVRAFVDERSDPSVATILCGDFNINGLTEVRAGEYACLAALFGDFCDAFADEDPITFHPHPDHNPLAHRFEPRAAIQRVDYVLYRAPKDTSVETLEVSDACLFLRDPLAHEGIYPSVHASDHFGLAVTLSKPGS
ncbi:MAG: endonuclease/exonuclease/phosphatase family protein [Polyangiaceae bacterium]